MARGEYNPDKIPESQLSDSDLNLESINEASERFKRFIKGVSSETKRATKTTTDYQRSTTERLIKNLTVELNNAEGARTKSVSRAFDTMASNLITSINSISEYDSRMSNEYRKEMDKLFVSTNRSITRASKTYKDYDKYLKKSNDKIEEMTDKMRDLSQSVEDQIEIFESRQSKNEERMDSASSFVAGAISQSQSKAEEDTTSSLEFYRSVRLTRAYNDEQMKVYTTNLIDYMNENIKPYAGKLSSLDYLETMNSLIEQGIRDDQMQYDVAMILTEMKTATGGQVTADKVADVTKEVANQGWDTSVLETVMDSIIKTTAAVPTASAEELSETLNSMSPILATLADGDSSKYESLAQDYLKATAYSIDAGLTPDKMDDIMMSIRDNKYEGAAWLSQAGADVMGIRSDILEGKYTDATSQLIEAFAKAEQLNLVPQQRDMMTESLGLDRASITKIEGAYRSGYIDKLENEALASIDSSDKSMAKSIEESKYQNIFQNMWSRLMNTQFMMKVAGAMEDLPFDKIFFMGGYSVFNKAIGSIGKLFKTKVLDKAVKSPEVIKSVTTTAGSTIKSMFTKGGIISRGLSTIAKGGKGLAKLPIFSKLFAGARGLFGKVVGAGSKLGIVAGSGAKLLPLLGQGISAVLSVANVASGITDIFSGLKQGEKGREKVAIGGTKVAATAIGTAIGAVIGGPIGAVVGAGLGTLVSDLFATPIGKWVSNRWDDVKNFFKKNEKEVDPNSPWSGGGGNSMVVSYGTPKEVVDAVTIDGSHKFGLNRVPFDGYVSELHKDEAVLTKPQADEWRSGTTMRSLVLSLAKLDPVAMVTSKSAQLKFSEMIPLIYDNIKTWYEKTKLDLEKKKAAVFLRELRKGVGGSSSLAGGSDSYGSTSGGGARGGATPGAGDYLGKLASKYESSGDPGMVSNAMGGKDPGGISYGLYQYATKTGSAKAFQDWLLKEDPSYSKYFQGKTPGTAAFGDAWKRAYAEKGEDFANKQRKHISLSHTDPWIAMAKEKTGVDFLSDRALQEAAMSTAIQHGPGSSKYLRGIREGMSTESILRQLYKNRTELNSTTGSVRESLTNRFKQEVEDAMTYIGQPAISYSRGTPYVPEDQSVLLHKGEMVVPAEYNPHNSTNRVKEAPKSPVVVKDNDDVVDTLMWGFRYLADKIEKSKVEVVKSEPAQVAVSRREPQFTSGRYFTTRGEI